MKILGTVLVLLAVIRLVVYLTAQDPSPPLPPALTRAEVTALPDNQQAPAVVNELRRRLQAAGPAGGSWRQWPEPARHALAWSWAENPAGPIGGSPFPGFAGLVANHPRHLPEAADLAAAADALGAATSASTARVAAASTEGADLATLDRQFLAAIASERTRERLHRYIRQHLDELLPQDQP